MPKIEKWMEESVGLMVLYKRGNDLFLKGASVSQPSFQVLVLKQVLNAMYLLCSGISFQLFMT